MASPSKTSVFGLALADLIHERSLAICMIIALAAILSPLLIVMGLKEGVITNLRTDLIEDPVNREIRPTQTQNLPENWFEEIAKREDVSFLVPGILRGASIVRVRDPSSGRSEAIDLLPTGAGDPLLVENGATPPGPGQAAVSTPLAQAYDLEPGSRLRLEVTRTINNRPEVREVILEVSGVLGIRGDALKRVYAPLDLVVDVESYKEGFAVTERGWAGEQPEPVPVYDAAIIALPNELSALQRSSLTVATGFSQMEDLAPGEFEAIYGFPAPEGFAELIKLTTIEATVTSSSFRQIANELRGRGALILPLVKPFEIMVDGDRVEVTGYTVTARQAERYDLVLPPWARLSGDAPFRDQAKLLRPASPGEDKPSRGLDEPGTGQEKTAIEDAADTVSATNQEAAPSAGSADDPDQADAGAAPIDDVDAPEASQDEASGAGRRNDANASGPAGASEDGEIADGASEAVRPSDTQTPSSSSGDGDPVSEANEGGMSDASGNPDDQLAADAGGEMAGDPADMAVDSPQSGQTAKEGGDAPSSTPVTIAEPSPDADALPVDAAPDGTATDGDTSETGDGEASEAGPAAQPLGGDEADAPAANPEAARVRGPEAFLYETPEEVVASSPGMDGAQVAFPLDIIGEAPGPRALIPLEMAARLRAIQERGATYDSQSRTLLLDRAGYRGFRLYARSIDDVPGLVSVIEARDIPVTAKVSEIVGLQRFSGGLDRIFFLVAIVGVIGGTTSLVASLYAAVQRKKREISVMRLLGLSPGGVFRFPVYQGILLGVGAIALSYGVYRFVGSAINAVLADEMTGRAVLLEGWQLALVGAGVLIFAMLSALVAAVSATRIEPADALRVE